MEYKAIIEIYDPITVYYKEKTISNPNSDTGMNYVLVH
jgi:hypothetical protein